MKAETDAMKAENKAMKAENKVMKAENKVMLFMRHIKAKKQTPVIDQKSKAFNKICFRCYQHR